MVDLKPGQWVAFGMRPLRILALLSAVSRTVEMEQVPAQARELTGRGSEAGLHLKRLQLTRTSRSRWGLPLSPLCLNRYFMNLVIDSDTVFTTDGGSSICGTLGYSLQAVNLDAYADGNMHNVKFFSRSYGTNGNVTNFFVDEVTLYACPFVGIDENLLDKLVNISPNPASNFINVTFEGLTSNRVRIEIYDALGKLTEQTGTMNVSGSHTETIDVSGWNQGIYLIRVYDGDYFTVKKALVK